jgi:hypothetical protein
VGRVDSTAYSFRRIRCYVGIMDRTEQLLRRALAEIREDPRRDLSMPHGFEVERVVAEEVPNMFAPDLLSEKQITIGLRVPVIYSARLGPRGLRARLPAERRNLKALRAAVVSGARAQGLRARLREWRVTPEDAPEPYLPDGKPNGPPADWSVTAILEVH